MMADVPQYRRQAYAQAVELGVQSARYRIGMLLEVAELFGTADALKLAHLLIDCGRGLDECSAIALRCLARRPEHRNVRERVERRLTELLTVN